MKKYADDSAVQSPIKSVSRSMVFTETIRQHGSEKTLFILTYLDDLIVNKISNDEIYIVSNASMAEQDMKILTQACADHDANLSVIETSLIAVQVKKFD